MVNYRFFSRKNGWVRGADVKYFHSHEIVDELNETSIFIDWNGKQILNSLDRITNQNLHGSNNHLKCFFESFSVKFHDAVYLFAIFH